MQLSTPRITVGLPVYKGADLIGKCLDCLQRQTFGNFEAVISVDGGDEETAAACRPFLTDPRFRMVIHPERLDWVGNFNWLLQQDLQEFFCYRQHDDTTAPEFFEVLLQTADKEPNAAAIYSDCQYNDASIEVFPSIEGEPWHRVFQYVQRVSAVPVRGLIRRPAIRHAGLVRSDEFRAVLQIGGWLAKLLHWGSFRRIAKPMYYRLYRADSLGHEYHHSKSENWKQVAWTTMFTALLDGAIPICRTPEERLFMQQAILHQIIAYPHFHPNREPSSSARIIADCLKRLTYEGNTHLLRQEELLTIFQQLNWLERSRMRRAVYRIRKRSKMARIFYPRSKMRRVIYQISALLEDLRHKMSRPWLPG
jgi:glycosyltransferase involved in cell wall biosynthesis